MIHDGDVELCDEPIVIEADEAVLGIHTTHASPNDEYVDGHAWVTLETEDETYFFGLWPDGHPAVANNSEFCSDVRRGMEEQYQPAVSRYYRMTPSQISRFNHFVNRPDVWRVVNNCTDWVVDLLKDVLGVTTYAVDHSLFSTPRRLGQYLKRLEAKNPTSPMAPRIGEFQEAVNK